MSLALSAFDRGAIGLSPTVTWDDTPRSFAHELHLDPAFVPDALAELARSYDPFPADYYIAAGASAADTRFAEVPTPRLGPSEALARIDDSSWRVLLKRPENHSAVFRHLLLEFRDSIRARLPERESITRLESAIFITSAASITPFHFDPETALFSQIAGEKRYHVYPPSVLTEPELEAFYVKGMVEIGQVSLQDRDPRQEKVFELRPGAGFYQPQNAPHWVETTQTRSVSYSVVFETLTSRRLGASRAFNHLLRTGGLTPGRLGDHPAIDYFKARGMAPTLRVWKRCKRLSAQLSSPP